MPKRSVVDVARGAIRAAAARQARRPGRGFLGVDPNTNITGLAALAGDGSLLHCDYVNTRAEKNPLVIGSRVGGRIAELRDEMAAHGVRDWEVAVEAFLKSVSTARMHTQTLFVLAQLNSIIVYDSWRHLGCQPLQPHASSVRGTFQLNAQAASAEADKPVTIKELVLALVSSKFPSISWPTTKSGAPSPAAYDMADACLIAMYARAACVTNDALRDADALAEMHDMFCARHKLAPADVAPARPDLVAVQPTGSAVPRSKRCPHKAKLDASIMRAVGIATKEWAATCDWGTRQ